MKPFITSFLGVLSISCASACGPATLDFPVDLQIGAEFTPAERDLIIEAVGRWEEAAPLISINLIERYTYDEPSIIRGRHSSMPAWAPGGTVQSAEWNPVVIYIDSDLLHQSHGVEQEWRSVFTSATMHELGHWMGLEHGPSGVMYRSLCQKMVGLGCAELTAPCVYDIDIHQFCSLYDCDYKALECEDVP